MATENPPKICVQSKFIETHKTLDLSQIMDNIDTFSQGDVIETTELNVGDIVFDIDFYPKGKLACAAFPGEEDSATDTVALFVNVLHTRGSAKGSGNDKKIDNRKMYVCIKHAYDDRCWKFMDTIDYLSSQGVGFTNLMSLSALKNHPNLQINIKLFGDPLFVSKE
eukprot:403512_1